MILNGRSEFIEKYQGVVQELLDRDFDVLAFDWRGQGLSDRLLPDPNKGHVEAYEDYLNDVERVVDLAIERSFPSPLIMLAHSMGGQIGLRFMHARPELFAGAAMTAPMVRLKFGRLPYQVAASVIRLMCAFGRSTHYAFGQGSMPYAYHPFSGNVLTSSLEHFQAYRALIDADPGLGLGGATFGWLRAGLRSCATTSRPDFLKGIPCPVLLARASEDELVDNEAIVRLAARLPKGELLYLAGSRHEILIETKPIRDVFWAAFDGWLKRFLV